MAQLDREEQKKALALEDYQTRLKIERANKDKRGEEAIDASLVDRSHTLRVAKDSKPQASAGLEQGIISAHG